MKKMNTRIMPLLLAALLLLSACGSGTPATNTPKEPEPPVSQEAAPAAPLDQNPSPDTDIPENTPAPEGPDIAEEPAIPEEPVIPDLSSAPFHAADAVPYTEDAYTIVNDNQPYFSESDLTDQSFEFYSELDDLGRCQTAYASIGLDLMPTEKRESIGQVRPSGWQTVKYDIVDGNYLYNRCHLIGYQLSGENSNEKNLITGTRYLNVQGMLPFENMVADYVKETGNHVLYRVTPIYEGDNLLASGVLMEAESVEDQGGDILFCVYVYNIQPGITIDYATGESALASTDLPLDSASAEAGTQETTPSVQEPAPSAQEPEPSVQEPEPQGTAYILNTNTKKFHIPSCSSVKQMKDSNKQEYTGNREDIIAMGYDPCKRCHP